MPSRKVATAPKKQQKAAAPKQVKPKPEVTVTEDSSPGNFKNSIYKNTGGGLSCFNNRGNTSFVLAIHKQLSILPYIPCLFSLTFF
jgi:hypothetical protein